MQLQVKISPILHLFIFLSAFYAISINGVEQKCSSNKDCYRPTATQVFTMCEGGRCLCYSEGQRFECNLKTAEMSDFIFGSCPCAMPFTECKDDVCYCKGGFIPSEDMRRCIPNALLFGEYCERDEQCQATDIFTTCDNALNPYGVPECQCRRGYVHANDGKCRSLMDTSTPLTCYNDNHCLSQYKKTQCATEVNRCVCDRDLVNEPYSHHCAKNAEWGQLCSFDEQCEKLSGVGAECINEKCRCKEPFVVRQVQEGNWHTLLKDYICVHPAGLGDFCMTDKDCYDSNLEKQTLHCYNQRCKCKYGYVSKTVLICKTNCGCAHQAKRLFALLVLVVCLIIALLNLYRPLLFLVYRYLL